jgi:hypothetical protein
MCDYWTSSLQQSPSNRLSSRPFRSALLRLLCKVWSLSLGPGPVLYCSGSEWFDLSFEAYGLSSEMSQTADIGNWVVWDLPTFSSTWVNNRYRPRSGLSRARMLAGARHFFFSLSCSDRFCRPPSLLQIEVKRPSLILTSHLHPAPILTVIGAIPLFRLCAFMTWTL